MRCTNDVTKIRFLVLFTTFFSPHRWLHLLRSARGRWRSCWLCVPQMNLSFFLLKTVVHLVFVFAKRPLQVPWCSVSCVEKFSTWAAWTRPQTLSMAKPGCVLFVSVRENHPWTRSCHCWLHSKGFGFDCQKETPCASSSREQCDGSTEFSRPAQRECWRRCQRWSVHRRVITWVVDMSVLAVACG